MSNPRKLLDDCFLHDKDRLKHAEVLETIGQKVSLIVEDETAPLEKAAARICSETITAPRNVPLTDNAAVDGYAFSHADYVETNGKLEIGALIAAGHLHDVTLKPCECARIFTGATMPTNAETVAMQEDCVIDENGTVSIPSGLKKGANCRLAGEDLKSGDVMIAPGDFLTPARIAALASIGIGEIGVRQKLRVALLSTGDEIIEPGSPIKPGQIYDANRPMLKALLDHTMIELVDFGILPDTERILTEKLNAASKDFDLILTSGGASRGDEDHMLNALDKLGKRHLWQIAIKPGRPMMFGQIGNCVVVGLPGNPVASFVCTLQYVFPVIYGLTGARQGPPQSMAVPAGFEITKKKKDRREFLRGWLETDQTGTTRAIKFDRDGSGLISGLRRATGLIEIPEDVGQIMSGDLVKFVPFSSFGPG